MDLGEECDDDNVIDGDGCDDSCDFEYCGDGAIQNYTGHVEICDDGNNNNQDGCNELCQPEYCGDSIIQTNL